VSEERLLEFGIPILEALNRKATPQVGMSLSEDTDGISGALVPLKFDLGQRYQKFMV